MLKTINPIKHLLAISSLVMAASGSVEHTLAQPKKTSEKSAAKKSASDKTAPEKSATAKATAKAQTTAFTTQSNKTASVKTNPAKYDPDKYSPSGLPVVILTYRIADKDGPGARKILDKIAPRQGSNDERQLWLAACCSVEQRYEEAVSIYEKTQKKEPAPSIVILRIAKAYASMLNFDKAISLLTELLSWKKIDDAYALRGTCYSAKKDDLAAARDYQEASKVCPPPYEGMYLIKAAKAFDSSGKTAEALALIERAEKTDHSPIVYMVKGQCYEKLKNWTKAIESFDRAEKEALKTKDKKNDYQFVLPVCYKSRANCYGKLGNLTKQKLEERRFEQISKDLEYDLIDSK